MAMQSWKKFDLSEKNFNDLRTVIYDLTGISLKENKKEMLYSRLSKRLRELGLTSFDDYLALFEGEPNPDEISLLVNAVTTNLTRFFREDHHYTHMHDKVLPEMVKWMQRDPSKEFLVWSAGCSAGMEAYSAAMVIYDAMPKDLHSRVKILATDIDTNMINHGKAGIYTASNRETVPAKYHRLTRATDKSKSKYQIHEDLMKMVHFKYLNLLQKWPLQKKFDVIFCRNVMIYFDRETRDNLIDRYINQLYSQAHLYLGHAESLVRLDVQLDAKGHSIFQRK